MGEIKTNRQQPWDGAKGDFLNVSMMDSHLTLPIDLISIFSAVKTISKP